MDIYIVLIYLITSQCNFSCATLHAPNLELEMINSFVKYIICIIIFMIGMKEPILKYYISSLIDFYYSFNNI